MKEFMADIFAVALISGIIFLIASVQSYFYPPKKINAWIGYRTAAAIRSQERWDFAQKYSSLVRIKASLVLIAVSFTGYFFPKSEFLRMYGSIVMIIVWVSYMTLATEKELKKRFSEIKK